MEISGQYNIQTQNYKPNFEARLNIDKKALKTAQETFNEMRNGKNIFATPNLGRKICTFLKGVCRVYRENGFAGVKLFFAETFNRPANAKSSFAILKRNFEKDTADIPGNITITTRERKNLLPGQHSDLTYKIDKQDKFEYKFTGPDVSGKNIDYPMESQWDSGEALYGYQTPNVLPVNIHPLTLANTKKQLIEEVIGLTKNTSGISPFDKLL